MATPQRYTFRVTGYLAGGKVAPEFERPWLRSGLGACSRSVRTRVTREFKAEFPGYRFEVNATDADS